jgi:hypothetical protein
MESIKLTKYSLYMAIIYDECTEKLKSVVFISLVFLINNQVFYQFDLKEVCFQ